MLFQAIERPVVRKNEERARNGELLLQRAKMRTNKQKTQRGFKHGTTAIFADESKIFTVGRKEKENTMGKKK